MSWGPMSTFNFEQRMRDVSILHDALNNSPELKHFLRQQIFRKGLNCFKNEVMF